MSNEPTISTTSERYTALRKERRGYPYLGAFLGLVGGGEGYLFLGPYHIVELQILIGASAVVAALTVIGAIVASEWDIKRAKAAAAIELSRWRKLAPSADLGPSSPEDGFRLAEGFTAPDRDGQQIGFLARFNRWSAEQAACVFATRAYQGPRIFSATDDSFTEVSEALIDFYFAIAELNRKAQANRELVAGGASHFAALPQFSEVISS